MGLAAYVVSMPKAYTVLLCSVLLQLDVLQNAWTAPQWHIACLLDAG